MMTHLLLQFVAVLSCLLISIGPSSAQQCICVVPTSCPEALVNAPKGCTLSGGGNGVCCPQQPTSEGDIVQAASARPAARRSSANVGPVASVNGGLFPASSVGGVGSRESSFASAGLPSAASSVVGVGSRESSFAGAGLPSGAQQFLSSLPSGDADGSFTFRDSGITLLRPTAGGAQGSTALAPDTSFPTEQQRQPMFSVAAPSRVPPPTGTTRINQLNARTSQASQQSGEQALQFLSQVVPTSAASRGGGGGGDTISSIPLISPFNFGGASVGTLQPSELTRFAARNARTSVQSQDEARTTLRTLETFGFQPGSRFETVTSSPSISRFLTSPGPGGCTPESPVSCRGNARYRTIDGSCNNLRETHWGRSFRGLRRIFPNTFHDGIFAMRRESVSGAALPSARQVSVGTFSDTSREANPFTMSVVTFGQFTDHDLSITPVFQNRRPDNTLEPIECCSNSGQTLPVVLRHPQCIPISVSANDPFYEQWGIRCMNLVRSIPAVDPQCKPGPATHVNELTGWLDLSQVYGSTNHKASELREHSGGRMKTSSGDLPPREVPNPGTNCTGPICFIAGDERVNENTLLTVFHTVWIREHNRIAAELQKNHGSWNDERLYHEARRIAVAEWQHILYSEWLPLLLGFHHMRRTGLSGGGFFTYAPHLEPTVSTEFSTAAFRLHSMVQGVIDLVNQVGSIRQRLKLTDNFFKSDDLVIASVLEDMARGLTRQPPETYDQRFTESVRGNLFKVGPFGLDLTALNIQRGRDHGIPTYHTVAARCNGFQINSFESFLRLMSHSEVTRLKNTYSDYRDVDLFVGMNLERPASGALVGPTVRCILTDQFLRARYGDRYFYDQLGFSHSFTVQQFLQIRRASWARILCDNIGGGFNAVQPLAFFKPISFYGINPVVSCSSPRIRRVNLQYF